MARTTIKTYQVRFETQGFKAVAQALDDLNEKTKRELRLGIRTEGLDAVLRDFEAVNKRFTQTAQSYRQLNQSRFYVRDDRGRFSSASETKQSYSRDSQGRFARQGFDTNFAAQLREEEKRFLAAREQFFRSRMRLSFDNSASIRSDGFEGTARSRGRFDLDQSTLAREQGRTIGEYAAKAIKEEQLDLSAAIKSGFQFAVTSTLSGAFQRIGEKTIADPILNAMRQAFAENRKIDQNQKNILPSGSNSIGFAAKSVAFGGFQQIGSKISEILTEDFIKGLGKGFRKRSKGGASLGVESAGESVGSFVADPLGTAKDTIRERKIAKLDDSLAEAEKLAKEERVTVAPGKVKVFTVGGLGGSGIADFNENLERIGINPDIADIENTENPNTGTNIPLSDPLRFASDAILNKYLTNEVLKGQNQDAINLAAKVISARRNNPDAKINLVGHSAGADIVQQAIAILEKGGYADNVQGIGVGGIDIGTGFDVKNFTNIAGDNDYVVKATQRIGSKPTTKDFGQVSQVGDHKLRTYFAHPDFIKALDKDLQPTAVVKILDNFYEDMILAYGDDALPLLEEALKDGQKFAEEFDQNFGTEETARINAVLDKYNQRRVEISGNEVSRKGIKPKPEPANTAAIVDRQFQRVQEIKAAFLGKIGQPKNEVHPQDIPIAIVPDSPRPVNIPIDTGDPDLEREQRRERLLNLRKQRAEAQKQYRMAAEMQSGVKGRVLPDVPRTTRIQVEQGDPRRVPRVIPIDDSVDPVAQRRWEEKGEWRKQEWARMKAQKEAQAQMRRASEIQRQAQENAKQLEPSQLAAQQSGTPQAFVDESELSQLIEAYQVALVNAVKESGQQILSSLEATMDMAAQSAVEGGDELAQEFATQVNRAFYAYADRIRKIYFRAFEAMKGVGSSASKGVNRGNFKQSLEQLRKDFSVILGNLQSEMVQEVGATISSMESLLESYKQDYAPPTLAGATARPDVERLDQLIQDQVMTFQESLEKLFLEVLKANSRNIEGLQVDRARLGIPAQAALPTATEPQRVPIGQRYRDYLTGKIQSARANASERVRAMLPVFKRMNIPQRDQGLREMKAAVRQSMEQFRQLMAQGDRQSARQLGEGLLQRVEAIKEAYSQIGEGLGIRKKTGGHKSEMTKFSNEIQRDLQSIAENASGSFADEIESNLGNIGDSGDEFGDAFLEGIRSAFQIESPSKKMQEIGKQVGKGFEIGAVKALKEAREAIQKEIEYLVALQQGDMKKAFGMVEKQAQLKGYGIGPVYHGSPQAKTIKSFDPSLIGTRSKSPNSFGAFFFSPDRSVADAYAADNTEARRDWFEMFPGEEPRGIPPTPNAGVLSAFLRLQKAINSGTSKKEIIHAAKGGYDSIWNHRQREFAVFSPSQIKSADAVTRTDRGKIVPLGARFDDSTDDIRGNVENLSSFISEELDQFFGDLAKQIRNDIAQVGSDSIEGLTQGLKGGLADLETIAATLGIALIESTEDSLGIQSPSKKMMEIGKQIAEGLGIGVRENLETVKDDLVGDLGEILEEAEFQLKRGLTKFEDSGGIAGLDKNTANAIAMVRSELEGLLERLPLLKNLLAFGAGMWAQFALIQGTFAAVGKAFQVAGLGQFISALASLPDTAAQAGQEAESLALAFESVTGSSELAAQSMEYVSDVARKFSIDVRAAEEAYLGLVATTRGTELEGFQTQQIFEAFAQTAALRGLSQQQQGQMFTAVQQVLGKGKLSAEEVRGQLGEIPALAFQQTLADSLGVNLQQLDKLLSGGQLQSDALFKVAQTYAAANAQLSQGMGTAAQSATRFENAVVALQRAFGSQFLGVQREGLAFFAGLLEGIANRAESLAALLRNTLILVLGNLITMIFGSATALTVVRMALVALINLIQRLLPFLTKFATGLVAVNLAIEVWSGVINSLKLSDAENQVLALSAAYQDLGVSIEEAAQKQGLMAQIRQGAGDFVNWTQERLGIRTTREYQAGNAAAFSQAQTSVANLALADQQAGIKAAERMLDLEQRMVEVKTYRTTLTAADGAELERTNEILKELRSQYDGYLESVSQSRTRAQSAIQASKAIVDELRGRQSPYLSEAENQQLESQIEIQLRNIQRLEAGQAELNQATSQLQTALSVFATVLDRAAQRVANVRERLTNQFNEERANLIQTGLSLGQGEQTIRLQLDRADFRELETWIHTLRTESQQLTQQLKSPDLAPQVANLQERARLEGTDLGTETLQRIIQENGENVEAARGLLQLQDLQNQISQGELQLAQQALQSRQSIRDMTRSIADFLRQLDQELAEIRLQLEEQILRVRQQFRRTQLEQAIVAGSTGVFGSVVSGVQGMLDQAGEIAQRLLGQERQKLEFQQRRYDLATRLQDFGNSLGGATEALEEFRRGLTGGPASGSLPSQVAGEVLLGITGSSGTSSGPHLDIRKRGGDRALTNEELDRFNVNGRPLRSYQVTSGFGPRNTGIPGASTDHRGIDFGIETGGRITTTVPIERVTLRDPSQTGGGGWVTDVLFADGLEVSLLHLDPSTQRAGIANGRSGSVAAPRGRMTAGQLRQIAQQAGFSGGDAETMAAIALAESSGDPRAHNPNAATGDDSYGLWQINMLGAMGPERRRAFGIQRNEQLFDPTTNARAAREIYESQGFGAWSVYRSGAYRQFLADARSAQAPGVVAPTGTQPQGALLSGVMQQAQSMINQINNTGDRIVGAEAQEIGHAVQSFVQFSERTIEGFRRETEQAYNTTLRPLVLGMEEQVQQFLTPDAASQQQIQIQQQFRSLGLESRQAGFQVEDSLRELELITTTLPPIIQTLRATGDSLDNEQANSLEKVLGLYQNMILPVQDLLERLNTATSQINEARDSEQSYQSQRLQIEEDLTRIAREREVAQGGRQFALDLELATIEEQLKFEQQRLEVTRQFSGRPEQLSAQLGALTAQRDRNLLQLQLQDQRNLLEEYQYQTDLQVRNREAQAAQAEGPRGDNGLLGFRAQSLREENAVIQEQIRFRQEILDLQQRYSDPSQSETLRDLTLQAETLRDLNLQNIDAQFKDLGETIEDVGTNSLSTFFNELFTGTQTIGQAMRALMSSVLGSLAQIAAQSVARSIVGRIAGAIGGAVGGGGVVFGGGGGTAFTSPAGWSGWKYGGTIPTYADGGRIVPDGVSNTLRDLIPGVNTSFIKEGSGAVLGVFTPGEEVLSLQTGEAQRYQMLKRTLGSNPLQSIISGNFAMGGTVGINPDILTGNVGRSSLSLPVSTVSRLTDRRSYGQGQSVTVNYQVNTPDANSFRKSQFQIDRDATLEAQRILSRR